MVKFTGTLALLLGAALAVPTLNGEDGTSNVSKRATSSWYPNMDHSGSARGYAPDLDSDFTYPVFKSVNPGDGAGIQTAINAGTNGATRHGKWLASQPRVSSPRRRKVESYHSN